MFMYTEIHNDVQHEVVAYIPIDKSAIYFEMGADFPTYLTKKVKIFQKMIKQIKYQVKTTLGENSLSLKNEFTNFSQDLK